MDYIILFTVFIVTLTSVFAGMQYVSWRMWKNWVHQVIDSPEKRKSWKYAAIAVIIFGNLLFFGRFLLQNTEFHNAVWAQWAVVYPGGIYFSGIFLIFLTGVVRYIIKAVRKFLNKPSKQDETRFEPKPTQNENISGNESTPLISRRAFLKTAGAAGFAAPFVLSTGIAASTHQNYVFRELTLYYPGLPSGLEGLRIAHLSDIHAGIFMNRSQVAEVFELTNSLDANLTVITGDMVDTHVSEIPDIRDNINSLKSDYGVFGCPGNHDHYASVNALTDALADRKIDLLQNTSRELKINGEKLSLIGIDDAGQGNWNFANPAFAYRKVNPDTFKILLTHRPHVFDDPHARHTDLVLAGHTHGGQIAIDFAGFEFYPIDWFQKYSRGLYTDGARKLFVNTGVGLVAAPIRLVKPEISCITLTAKPENASISVRSA